MSDAPESHLREMVDLAARAAELVRSTEEAQRIRTSGNAAIAMLCLQVIHSRDRALEEAARLAETWHLGQAELATAIRALKDKP